MLTHREISVIFDRTAFGPLLQALLVLWLVLLFAYEGASAGVVFDNGPPSISAGAWTSDSSNFLLIGDNFILPDTINAVTGVRWWGGYCCHGRIVPDDFSMAFFPFVDGSPSNNSIFETAISGVLRQTTGEIAPGSMEVFEYYYQFSEAVILESNEPFLLSIFKSRSTCRSASRIALSIPLVWSARQNG